MKNLFNSIKMQRPKNNVFDLSHDVKLSCNMGQLVPIMCTECVPGDKVQLSNQILLRLAPLVSPMMHRVDVYCHYFFVPNRLLWPNWEKFITNSPTLGVLPAFPYYTVGDGGVGSYSKLVDYLGIPPAPAASGLTENVSALPFAAYQKIYNEYYRDQNLIELVADTLTDGDNTAETELIMLRNRAWQHDYFTAALPFAQKGDPVSFPLSINDVQVRATTLDPLDEGNALIWDNQGGSDQPNTRVQQYISDEFSTPAQLYIKGDEVEGNTTINDLRRAFRLQEWLEKAARGGSRYVENILAHFGVRSSDKRLQRPEYITGTKSPISISEVLNTTGTEDAPQGNMAGHGISVTDGKYGSYYCEEHGYIIGIMSVMPKTAYQQGIPKHFLKTTDPFQFFWPSFAHIGEQEVLNKEVYAYQAGSAGSNTFGYVPRYAEYKFEQNRVAGEMRDTLDHWHMGRVFDAPPALNETFVTSDPTLRVFAVTDPQDDHLYVHVLNRVRAIRPMPRFGTPTF